MDALPRAPGKRRAQWVVEHARSKIESPLESLARAAIVLAGYPEPVPQVWLSTRSGPYRVDLLDERNRVITEADGKLKYLTPDELWKEKRREDALRDEGFEVVRFTMADHHHPAPWLATYDRALARSGARTMPPKSR
jgi:very-short-patch-repair endonuclease